MKPRSTGDDGVVLASNFVGKAEGKQALPQLPKNPWSNGLASSNARCAAVAVGTSLRQSHSH